MKFKEIFTRVGNRIRGARREAAASKGAPVGRRSVLDAFRDDRIEAAFRRAREMLAPDSGQLPFDFRLRQSNIFRRTFERVFPVTHVFRLESKYGREFLDDFMPIGPDDYIGRGSYKFVYRLPWRMVLKISKSILPSDPLFGSQFREVAAHQEKYLTSEELALLEYLSRNTNSRQKERLSFKFNRLGLERYQYWLVREGLPDLVLPTRFFMGVRYRRRLFGRGHTEKLTPMDSQIMLVGKHLKEFARAARKSRQGRFLSRFSPLYDFEFETQHFEKVKKKIILKITEDFRQLIRFTELLALRDKLILDIHSENIIVTLPEFELKIFDFHLFDEHLYEPSLKYDRPERDHIEVIEKFIDSMGLARR